MVPVTGAFALGIWLDRHVEIPMPLLLGLSLIAGIGQYLLSQRTEIHLPYFAWLCALGMGAGHHHLVIKDIPINDVSHALTDEPQLIRLRGTLDQEPLIRRPATNQPLISRPSEAMLSVLLNVSEIEDGPTWKSVTGLVRLSVHAESTLFHLGDRVELTGWLSSIPEPMNPGERSYQEWANDQGIRGEVFVRGSSESIVRLSPPEGRIIQRGLQKIREFAQRQIQTSLRHEGPLAQALLLGETSALSRDEWDQYARTGVIHVLAISGQHLVILGAIVWWAGRWLGIPRRKVAILVAFLLLGYAFLTGGRPSAMRAAVMVCVFCGGILIRKPVDSANTVAMAGLVVLILQPSDLFNVGFQLSFWCVIVLIGGTAIWLKPRERTPLEELIHESRHWLDRSFRYVGIVIMNAFAVTAILGLATVPLSMYWQHSIPLAGFVIGPFAILLTTIALIAGLLLMVGSSIPFIGELLSGLTDYSLLACDQLVGSSSDWSWATWYVPDVPLGWVVGFHIVSAWLIWRTNFRTAPESLLKPLKLLLVWLILGFGLINYRSNPDELRVTFLAVDHGNCTVIETPDGRVILCDSGSTVGPEIVRRVIAPFLWSRGISRIDELMISHADLDHFNGLPALTKRFAIGRVLLTPSFVEKQTPGVTWTLDDLKQHRIPIQFSTAGDLFNAGETRLTVLHPPSDGPPGIENVRSLVIRVEYARFRILITGDLEGEGIQTLVNQPAETVDVLMSPHHGSGSSLLESLVRWCQPQLVIASQGRNDPARSQELYSRLRLPYWGTWPNGAITLHVHPSGLSAETFATKRQMVIHSRSMHRDS